MKDTEIFQARLIPDLNRFRSCSGVDVFDKTQKGQLRVPDLQKPIKSEAPGFANTPYLMDPKTPSFLLVTFSWVVARN